MKGTIWHGTGKMQGKITYIERREAGQRRKKYVKCGREIKQGEGRIRGLG